ncbi:MAG: hypothetical protein LH472_15185, partial [Pyrinomonadaceae bacterium]|nr:hypothetical protein [Pyrinomonadaceae bacterium]
MSRKFGLIAIILVVTGAIVGGIFGRLPVSSSADSSLTTEKVAADYQEALDVINKNYVSEVDREKISESSIQGMLYTLDPHSSFFTRDEFRKLYEDQSSQFYGVGVSILQHRDGVGYVGLTGGFQETTAQELDAAIAELKKQGMKSLIVDLRNNPGGLLPQAIEVVSRFVPEGKTVVSVKG